MAEQKYEAPEDRSESMADSKKPSQDPASDRLSRGKQAQSAALAYLRECESDAAAKFSVSGSKRSKKGY